MHRGSVTVIYMDIHCYIHDYTYVAYYNCDNDLQEYTVSVMHGDNKCNSDIHGYTLLYMEVYLVYR